MSDYVRKRAVRYKLKPEEINACPPDQFGDIDNEAIGKNYGIPANEYDLDRNNRVGFVVGYGYNDKISWKNFIKASRARRVL